MIPAAIACFVIGLALAGLCGWRVAQVLPDSPQPISEPVRIDGNGLVIYTSPSFHLSGHSGTPGCLVTDSSGVEVPMAKPRVMEGILDGTGKWAVTLRSTRPIPAGVYEVVCAPRAGMEFAAGPMTSVAGFILWTVGVIASLVVFGGLGIVLLIVGLVERRRPAPSPPTR